MEFLDYLKENNIDYKEEDGKIVVKGDLYLRNTSITKLPDSLSVKGVLSLRYTNITNLPNKLSVGGSLDLSFSSITELPEGLSVGGYLSLNNTQITKLPDNLSVGWKLNLDAEKITNIACHKECEWFECPVFAAYVNGEIQISAGYFLGSLKAFETEVDKVLARDFITPTDAEKYKQSARECISELEQMRSRKN